VAVASLLVPPTHRVTRHTPEEPASHAIDDVDLPEALGAGGTLFVRSDVRNVDRTVGAATAGRITERFGDAGLPAASVVYRLTGAAGQSLGAFLVPGMEIDLCGEANDYVAKGMRGGTIAITPLTAAPSASAVPVIAGNAVLYGATGGRLFIAGAAGERFAVRNSGASAVVEEVGDHGCEYMTAGTVVLLGRAGRNFGSGMTGGTVYARFDLGGGVCDRIESMSPLGPGDWQHLESLLSEHWRRTGSASAAALLGRGAAAASALFRKLSPGLRLAEAGAGELLISIDRDLEFRDRQVLAIGVGNEERARAV
jgi:glutamate synthase domain-containing protein 3